MASATNKKKSKVSTYFKGVRSEMKKVVWPSKKELFNYTLVVVGISALVALIVWVLDILITGALGFII